MYFRFLCMYRLPCFVLLVLSVAGAKISAHMFTKPNCLVSLTALSNHLLCFVPTSSRGVQFVQGILKGEESLYCLPPVLLIWISLFCK